MWSLIVMGFRSHSDDLFRVLVMVLVIVMGSLGQILCKDNSSVLFVGEVLGCLQMGLSLMAIPSGGALFLVGVLLLFLVLMLMMMLLWLRCLVNILGFFLMLHFVLFRILDMSLIPRVLPLLPELLMVDMLLLSVVLLSALLIRMRLLRGDVIGLMIFIDRLANLGGGLVFSLQVLAGIFLWRCCLRVSVNGVTRSF